VSTPTEAPQAPIADRIARPKLSYVTGACLLMLARGTRQAEVTQPDPNSSKARRICAAGRGRIAG